ncbi:hypothetical protein [Celeribacter persicus]|uniref:hypothetical protein n=1 Tax=Celeribacter persicus TaxID=1651082 RepID=UPI000D31A19A|nr:hypothetical protein [Celeribacter persicus]
MFSLLTHGAAVFADGRIITVGDVFDYADGISTSIPYLLGDGYDGGSDFSSASDVFVNENGLYNSGLLINEAAYFMTPHSQIPFMYHSGQTLWEGVWV